jgi:peptidoglycan hydrolase CwlO-like protein
MKRSVYIFAVALLMIFALAPIGATQMMMGNMHGKQRANEADSTSGSWAMNADIMGMARNMSGNCNKTVSDFDKLQDHFNAMMQITDMATLKAEMEKHQAMMKEIHDNMVREEGMFKNMMSAIQTSGTPGVTGKAKTTNSGND